jgi:hypothetical protein
VVGLATAGAELGPAGLEGCELFELGGVLLHAEIEGVGEHAPVFLRAAFDAAVGSIAYAIEPRRVDAGKGLQHDGVDEREDGRGRTDAQRQGEHGGEGEDGRETHLADRVGDVVAQGLHGWAS